MIVEISKRSTFFPSTEFVVALLASISPGKCNKMTTDKITKVNIFMTMNDTGHRYMCCGVFLDQSKDYSQHS